MSKVSSKKIWVVGDRFQSKWDKSAICTLIKIRDGGKRPYTIEWDNKRKVHCDEPWFDEMKFLEEEGAITSCNLNTPVSSQESEVLTSELMPPEHQTSSKLNSSSKITATRNSSSATDFLVSPSTAISKTTTQSRENSTSTQLDFLVQEHQSQGTEPDLITQNQNSGLKPCGASPTVAPVSSSLKILQDLSTKDYEQFLGDSEWLAMSGMIRKSYQLRNLDRPKKEKGFSLLPTPTTYAKGSTGCRPAGATRLEQKLRPYLTKGDKLSPAVPGWMMGFPVGWAEYPLMDTGETISVQLPFIPEYATTSTNGEIVTTSTPVPSAPSKQQLQLGESVTSLTLLEQLKQSDVRVDLYICNSSFLTKLRQSVGGVPPLEGTAVTGGSIPPADFALNVGKITEVWQTCFTVDWSSEVKCYFWERDDRVIDELAIAPQSLITKFLEDESEPLVLCPSCELQHIYLSGGCGMCGLEPDMQRTHQLQINNGYSSSERPKADLVKNDLSQPIPENFLEESQSQPEAVQKPKGRQRKGCLYRYIENKKLKSGSIVSYPRVIGHRHPDNPTHWRWGFNWEEKVDGEWKGRSIGSVPLGAIALIQSMQNEGVSLEEIIGFIKRAKAKK